MFARLGAAAATAAGGGVSAAGSSSGISSHPEAVVEVARGGAIGTEGFEAGLGEVTGVALLEGAAELDDADFALEDDPFV